MKTKLFILLVLILAVSVTAFAVLKGRDVVDRGYIKNLEGKLFSKNGEWYLNDNGKEYIIHHGPESYFEQIGLKLNENDFVKIKGFVYENEITPIKVELNGKEYTFRDKDGKPLWAGSGRGRDNNRSQNRGDCVDCK